MRVKRREWKGLKTVEYRREERSDESGEVRGGELSSGMYDASKHPYLY